jgi:predicted nucleic-acid-binding Zn-ribbon protein
MEAGMDDAKICPKCSGSMARGRIMRFNEHVLQGKYLYLFSPDAETGGISGVLSGKANASRRPLVAYCCDQCGFIEWYGVAVG